MSGGGEQSAWNRPVFAAGGRTIRVGDVLLAAHCRGDLQPVWARLLRCLACEAESTAGDSEAGEDGPDDEFLQTRSEQFRYERELITAEETERWLEDRGLSVDDFNAYFVRQYWADAAEAMEEPSGPDYQSAPDDLWHHLIAELLLSGEFDRMARELAWRFGAADAERARPAAPPNGGPSEAPEPLADPGPGTWLARLECDPGLAAELPGLEAAYQRECRRLLTPEQIARGVSSMRMGLTEVRLESIDVDSLDAAREVALCVTQDGMTLSDVASAGGYAYEESAVRLEDLAVDVQQKVISAVPGSMLPPLAHEGGFHLHRLLDRVEPDPADADVRARVEQRMIARHFSELASGTVRWHLMPAGQPS